jgi:hypothetical protein
MTKLNTGSRLVKAPLQTEKVPTGKTHEGGAGFERDSETQLFMGCTTTFAGEGSFYETPEAHDARMVSLVREIVVCDFEWVEGFLPWLRQDAFIRTSAVMLAAEVAYALNGMENMTMRVARVVDKSMNRADEVTEIIAYCLSHFGVVPVAVRKGVELGILRMWNQRSVLRWDKPERPVRFADVIEIVHPNPRKVKAPRDLVLTHGRYKDWENSWEAAADFEATRYRELDRLFKYLLDERHHSDRSVLFEDGSPLKMIRARSELSRLTPKERHAFAAKALEGERTQTFEDRELYRAAAGQWEFIKSWLGEGARNLKTALSDRQRWELVFPWMGYEAVLKNLRNFEQAGITPQMVAAVQDRIADPEQVANSRQLPYRFLTAHLNTNGAQWLPSLETALSHSIGNVPLMRGRGLIMIDMSGSMQNALAQPRRNDRDDDITVPTRLQAAALFAMALALRNAGKVQVFGFADAPGGGGHYRNWLHREKKYDGNVEFQHIEPGASLLRLMDFVVKNIGSCGYGTAVEQNLRQVYDAHDWVAIFSDEQTIPGGPAWRAGWGDVGDITHCVPPDIPVFGWNLAGYQHGAFPTGGRRYALAGVNDSSFELMRRLMDGHSAKWPWE